MRPSLARAILQIYGESPVLDPMAGVGTTLVEAMLLGMNAVGVEYEKKFVDQANKNIEHVKKIFPNKNLGRAVCIQGDARDLSCLNNLEVNSILFSPPYANAIKKTIPIEFHRASEEWKRKASRSMRIACEQGYSSDEDNIGNISRFGSIIFSPPYFDALSIIKSHHKSKFAIKKKLPTHYSLNAKNIGNIPNFGSIIFSPPYLNSVPFHDVNFALDNRKVGDTRNCNYGSDPNNIGNLQKFGSIVFSPPLGEANKGSGIAKKGYKASMEEMRN